MKIASMRALVDMDSAAELRVHGAAWDTIAQVQIGTMGTKILNTSRARRKGRIRKVMRLVPEVVRAAPDDKLSLFVTILGAGGPVLQNLSPDWAITAEFGIGAHRARQFSVLQLRGQPAGFLDSAAGGCPQRMSRMSAPDRPQPDRPEAPKQLDEPCPENVELSWLRGLERPAELPTRNAPSRDREGGQPPTVADLILPSPPLPGDLKPPAPTGPRPRPSSTSVSSRPSMPSAQDLPRPPLQLPKLSTQSHLGLSKPLPMSPAEPSALPPAAPVARLPQPHADAPPKTEPWLGPSQATPKTEPLTRATEPMPRPLAPKTEPLHSLTVPLQQSAPKTEPLHSFTVPMPPNTPTTLPLHSLTVPIEPERPPAPDDPPGVVIIQDNFPGLTAQSSACSTPAGAEAESLPSQVTAVLLLPAEMAVGAPVALRVAVRNEGIGVARNVRIGVPLPDGLTGVAGPVVEFVALRLKSGEACEFEAEISATRRGEFSLPLLLGVNAEPRETGRATMIALASELHLRVQGPPTCVPGVPFDCRLTVSNLGNSAAVAVEVALLLPAGIDLTAQAGAAFDSDRRRLTWKIDALAPREHRDLDVTLSAREPTAHILQFEARDRGGQMAAATKSITCLGENVSESAFRGLNQAVAALDSDSRLFPRLVRNGAIPEPPPSAKEEPHLLFTLAGNVYAAALTNVVEVGRPPVAVPLPAAPDWLLGVATLGGASRAVIDLRAFLGLPRSTSAGTPRMLHVRHRGGASSAALLVDRVTGVRTVRIARAGVAGLSGLDRILPFVAGVGQREGRLLVFLDFDRLLLAPELQLPNPVPSE